MQMNNLLVSDNYEGEINETDLANHKYPINWIHGYIETSLNKSRPNYHTTNKCTNCMSFIFKSLF